MSANGAAPETVPPQRIDGRAAPVTIAGAEAPTADRPATFEMVASTGEPMRLDRWSDPVVVDLETADLSEPVLPALYDHWPGISDIVGQVDRLAIENRQLVARGRITPVEPDENGRGGNMGGEVLKVARQGYRWQASVGADPAEVVKIEAGSVGVANWGREYPGPCLIGRRCKFREMSFVVLGGDRRASVTVTGRHRDPRAIGGRVPNQPIRGAAAMNPTFEEWLAAMGFPDASALDATQSANMKLLYQDEYPEADAGEVAPTETAVAAANPAATATAAARPVAIRASRPAPRDPVAEQNRRTAANMERIERINAVAAEHGNPTADVGGRPVAIAAQAIRENWSVERAELAIIRAGRPNPQASRQAANDSGRLQALAVEAAVCVTAGLDPQRVGNWVPAADRERVMNEAVSARFRGYSLHAVMDETIRAAGQSFHGNRKSNDFIRAAFAADRMIRAGAQGFTTVSLSNVLGNTANKAMLAAYEAQAVVWKLVCAVRSHSDFKAVTRVRLDSTGAFKKVGPDGELKHVGLSDAAYTNQLATYGAIIALTRQMMINDDLGAFLEMPRFLGRMGALRIEELVFVTLLSNPASFFSSGNKNLLTGAGSAFGQAGVTASETAFDNQVDSNGKPILTMPDRVLVPTTLKTPAGILYKDTTLVTTTDTGVYSADNPHAGKYVPVVTPYLNNTAIKDQDGASISGQSDTAWYQMANPAVRAAIAVAFLNGQETPTIEDDDTDFSTLGRQWRAYHDFGVGMEDPTAAVKNAGA